MKNKKNIIIPELLAPAGDWPALLTAIASGADAVYFGVKSLNMRAEASNFEIDELKKVMKTLSDAGKKGYLTLNTIVFDDELKKLERILIAAKESKVNAVIAWDMAVVNLAKKCGLEVHLSTQASVANFESAKFFYNQGVSRIVLARESSLENIINIRKLLLRDKCPLELEVFIHGAQCVSVSGRCFLSYVACGKSANRGECVQPCRRKYFVKDKENATEYIVGKDYILSARDLCTIMFIDKLIEAGITAFKIEGRMRTPEYNKIVVSSYRRALDAYANGDLTLKLKKELFAKLEESYNRGFSNGFFLGAARDTGSDEASSGFEKIYLGEVVKYYSKLQVAAVRVRNDSLNEKQTILIYGKTTPVINFQVSNLQVDGVNVSQAQKGQTVSFKVPSVVRQKDKTFMLIKK